MCYWNNFVKALTNSKIKAFIELVIIGTMGALKYLYLLVYFFKIIICMSCKLVIKITPF